MGAWSPSDYSVCPCTLHQFYAYLRWTGQVVRYSSLRQITPVYIGFRRLAGTRSSTILKLCLQLSGNVHVHREEKFKILNCKQCYRLERNILKTVF